jgi:hypothetical protein
MEISCTVIELNPGSKEKVAEWARFINENEAGALATLQNEGVTVESAFVVTIEGKDYLVGYMRALNMEKAHEAAKTSTSEVDEYHRAFKKETWGKRFQAKLLSDLSRIKNEEDCA